MKVGAMNNPRMDLLEEIRWISENGFDFIDLTIEPPGAYHLDVREVKKALLEYGLEAIGHTNPFLPIIFPIESIREVSLKEFEKYIHIFNEFEIELMNIHPSYRPSFLSDEEKIEANLDFLKKVSDIAMDYGITLMLENFVEPFGTPDDFERLIREIPKLKVHLDVGHCNLKQERNLTGDFFERFGEDIVHVHFSDNWGLKDDHLPLGCGNIDWEDIIGVLKNYGYDGTITLEIFSSDRDYLLLSREAVEMVEGLTGRNYHLVCFIFILSFLLYNLPI